MITKLQGRRVLALISAAITVSCVAATIIISGRVSIASGIPDIPVNDLAAQGLNECKAELKPKPE